MPIYDCGDPDCWECQRAFGPDRTKAITRFKAREAAYAVPYTSTAGPVIGGRQDAGGGVEVAEKVSELATLDPDRLREDRDERRRLANENRRTISALELIASLSNGSTIETAQDIAIKGLARDDAYENRSANNVNGGA